MLADPITFTERQTEAMNRCQMSMPIPLHTADLTRPFVYDREWGLFYVPVSRHVWSMATLFAFHAGADDVVEYMDTVGCDDAHDLADRLLMEYPGTAFLSSVGRSIIVGRHGHLDAMERQCFRESAISYLEDDEDDNS